MHPFFAPGGVSSHEMRGADYEGVKWACFNEHIPLNRVVAPVHTGDNEPLTDNAPGLLAKGNAITPFVLSLEIFTVLKKADIRSH
jgi:hypothetical protein